MPSKLFTATTLTVAILGGSALAQRAPQPTDMPAGPKSLLTHIDDVGGIASAFPPAATCPRVVLAQDGGTSGNARAPSTRFAGSHAVYLITAAELAAAGYVNGTIPTTIGWNYQTAPGVSGSAPLKVYMQNTADTVYSKGTSWAAAIAPMTLVSDGVLPTTLPGTAGPFDVALTGGSPFTYVGSGLYIAYEWGPYAGTLSTTAVVWCNFQGQPLPAGGLAGVNSTADALGLSNFRPETRLNGVPLTNDAAVTYVYALGEEPPCQAGSQVIKATVVNNGSDTLTNLPVTLNVAGADTFTDTQNVASLASCGGSATVTFASYTPSAIGSGTVTVSVPSDTNVANNSLARNLNNTQKDYSYKTPGSTAQGGVGFTGGSGSFVAKFPLAAADSITDIKLEFFAASATTYRAVIYSDSGSGTPSTTTLYLDAADRTVAAAGPVTINLPSPVAVGPGNVYVGVQQTNTTNANYSFDNENPVRAGTFFFSATVPAATWADFSPGTNFKLNVGLILQTGCTAPPACAGDIAPAGGNHVVDVNDLLAVVSHWGPCPGTCPPACVGDHVPAGGNCVVDVNDLLGVVAHWGPCP